MHETKMGNKIDKKNVQRIMEIIRNDTSLKGDEIMKLRRKLAKEVDINFRKFG